MQRNCDDAFRVCNKTQKIQIKALATHTHTWKIFLVYFYFLTHTVTLTLLHKCTHTLIAKL